MATRFTFTDFLKEIEKISSCEITKEEEGRYKDLFYKELPKEYKKAVEEGYQWSFKDFCLSDIYSID